ncbi:hypothetical protein BDV34DRAFT_199062 [Aspergillus parasiticus]|uniref:Transmembrane protein n=1 Tax=Aspergillus parasiticus TaxID=5067 RepID=A0A5N6DEF3_ASPPA|nr:hypothetical protein BDV34DRAFT_199062 [Aspergillus parasiticus]
MKQADRNIKTMIGDFAMPEYGGGHESLRKKRKHLGKYSTFVRIFFLVPNSFLSLCVCFLHAYLGWMGFILGTFRFLYRAFLVFSRPSFHFFSYFDYESCSGYVRVLEGKDEVEGSYANERTES